MGHLKVSILSSWCIWYVGFFLVLRASRSTTQHWGCWYSRPNAHPQCNRSRKSLCGCCELQKDRWFHLMQLLGLHEVCSKSDAPKVIHANFAKFPRIPYTQHVSNMKSEKPPVVCRSPTEVCGTSATQLAVTAHLARIINELSQQLSGNYRPTGGRQQINRATPGFMQSRQIWAHWTPGTGKPGRRPLFVTTVNASRTQQLVLFRCGILIFRSIFYEISWYRLISISIHLPL